MITISPGSTLRMKSAPIMSKAQVSEVIKSVDADHNGTIEYGEFVSRLAAEWEWEDRPAVPPPPPAASPGAGADGEKGKVEDKREKEEGDKTADAKVSPRCSDQDL